MKTKTTFFTIFIILMALNSYCQNNNIKVILMLGQSNMVGHARNQDLNEAFAQYNINESSLHQFYMWADIGDRSIGDPMLKSWRISNDFVDQNSSTYKINNGFGVKSTRFGPEIGLAYGLKQNHPNTQFAFIKIAQGAKALSDYWSYGNTGYNKIEDGFNQAINAALTYANAVNGTIEVVGILWMQGESDATNLGFANNYGTNLNNFISRIRQLTTSINHPKYITNNNVPFVTGLITSNAVLDYHNQINTCAYDCYDYLYIGGPFSLMYSQEVRDAQKDTISRGNYSYFDTESLDRACKCYDDPIHYDHYGQFFLGYDFAQNLSPYINLNKTTNNSNDINDTDELIEDLRALDAPNNLPEISYYPNPITDNLHIKFTNNNGNKNIKIYDAFSRIIENIDTELIEIDIDLSKYSDGNYFLLIKEINRTVFSKTIMKYNH